MHDAAPIWITRPQYCMMKYCSASQDYLKITQNILGTSIPTRKEKKKKKTFKLKFFKREQ